jgi:hypothetical protein
LIDDEDNFCTICLETFELENGKFKVEVLDEEFIQDHKIHESDFHKKCIQKWMKDKNTCPICRKTLKIPFLNRVQKKMKLILYNPGFWLLVLTIFIMKTLTNHVCDPEFTWCEKEKVKECINLECEEKTINFCYENNLLCPLGKLLGVLFGWLSILIFDFWTRTRQFRN